MAEPTTYIVLRQGMGSDGKLPPWFDYHRVDATNSEAAIRKACSGDDEAAGTYVAVPARSWKPVTVTAVQQTTLKLEETKPESTPS